MFSDYPAVLADDDAIGIGLNVDRPTDRVSCHRVLVVVEAHQQLLFGWFNHRSPPYQDDILFASETVSLTTFHRRNRQAFRRALASACRNTMRSSGWNEITKSSPSRRIATFRLSGRLMTPISPDIGAPHCLTSRFPTSRIRLARARLTQDGAFRAGVIKRQQKTNRVLCMGKRLGERALLAVEPEPERLAGRPWQFRPSVCQPFGSVR